MKKITYIAFCLFTLISCTKEIDDDIFGGVDVDQLVTDPDDPDNPLIDPITGEPIDPDNPLIDPITGEPIVEIDPETGLPIEPDPEEVDPDLSGENELLDWRILDGNTELTNFIRTPGDDPNVFALVFLIDTDITNITIEFTVSENATIAESTTGLNFTTNDGVKIFTVIAENGDPMPYVFEITKCDLCF